MLETRTSSQGLAFHAVSNSPGGVAKFESQDPNLANPAVIIDNMGQSNALRVENRGDATGVAAYARGAGEAGRFEIPGQGNPSNALVGFTLGTGDGVNGFSRKRNGVFGRSEESITFNSPPVNIGAGVRGETGIGNSPDNFAVAGIGSGYGTGVLGVGAGGGHGVVGVPGFDEANRTIPGVWGFTREVAEGGGPWPPYFPIDGSLGPKGQVGVLGQGVERVGVWGESISRAGVVGIAGNVGNSSTPPMEPVGVYGEVLGDAGHAAHFRGRDLSNSDDVLVAESNGSGAAGYFTIGNDTNNSSTLVASTVGTAPVVDVFIENSTSNAPVIDAYTDGVGPAGRFHVLNTEEFAEPAVDALQKAKGSAGRFVVENPAASAAAMVVQTQGIGPAMEIRNFNATSGNNTVDVANDGLGRALSINATNNANSSNVVEIRANTAFHALYVEQQGPFEVAHFQFNNASSGGNGVYVEHVGPGTALKAVNHNPNFAALAFAALGKSAFNGQVDVIGNMILDGNLTVTNGILCADSVCAAVKNFEIDHPLDPKNRVLRHASVESDQMKNLYDGTVVLDQAGGAEVALPEWFTALNGDYRYQLTAVGGPAPNLHVSREITEGRFQIAGGAPGLKVCWQVTGVRQDAYAQSHPLEVEVDKPEHERGTYLHPEAFEDVHQESEPDLSSAGSDDRERT